MGLRVVPLTLAKANAFVAEHHRHNKRCRGHKFSFGVVDDTGLRGVAICGRPVARGLDDGLTLEISRTCTDGALGANSKLYATARVLARTMGYRRITTYIQAGETGESLKVAGFAKAKQLAPRGSWRESTQGELKVMRDPVGNGWVERSRWEINFGGNAP